MFDRLEIFRISGALAGHASQRQTVAAANIAQADTPGYRARAVESFADTYGTEDLAMRATRPGHVGGAPDARARIVLSDTPASPDGNTVAIETEMADAAQAMSDHDRALAIYQNGLSVLRAGLGRR